MYDQTTVNKFIKRFKQHATQLDADSEQLALLYLSAFYWLAITPRQCIRFVGRNRAKLHELVHLVNIYANTADL